MDSVSQTFGTALGTKRLKLPISEKTSPQWHHLYNLRTDFCADQVRSLLDWEHKIFHCTQLKSEDIAHIFLNRPWMYHGNLTSFWMMYSACRVGPQKIIKLRFVNSKIPKKFRCNPSNSVRLAFCKRSFVFSFDLRLTGTTVAQWLRCCATNRKVAGSIPDGVSGFFIDIKSFRSHYGPGSTLPLMEMSTSSISWG